MSTTIKTALDKIFSGIALLQKEYQGKKFTIDGRLVGDIGEILAENIYQIKLHEGLKKDYDAVTPDGKEVQIKSTFKDSLGFKNIKGYYIGLKIDGQGIPSEIYNGPAKYIYQEFLHRQGIGDKLLSFPIKRLKEISKNIPQKEKIPERT